MRFFAIFCLVLLPTITLASAIQPAPFLPDRQPITLDNLNQIQELQRIGNGYVNTLAWSPDGTTLAAAGSIGVWIFENIGSTPRLLEGHQGMVNAVAWSPDGKWLASASSDTTVRVWNTSTWETVQTFEGHGAAATAVAFSPDNRWLAVGADQSRLFIWDIETQHMVLHFRDPHFWHDLSISEYVAQITFSNDQKYIAWGTDTYTARESSVWLWDLGKEIPGEIYTPAYSIKELKFLEDNIALFIYQQHTPVVFWGIKNSEPLVSFSLMNSEFNYIGYPYYEGLLRTQSRQIISGDLNGNVLLWDAENGNYLSTLRYGHQIAFEPIQDMTLHPSENLLAVAIYGAIELYDLNNHQMINRLAMFNGASNELALSLNNQYLAFLASESELIDWIELWNLESGERKLRAENHGVLEPLIGNIAFDNSTTPPTLMFTNWSELLLCGLYCRGNLDEIQLNYTMTAHQPFSTSEDFAGSVYDVVASPDGHWLAVTHGSRDAPEISVSKDREVAYTLQKTRGIDTVLHVLGFSRDSQTMFYIDFDGVMQLDLTTLEARRLVDWQPRQKQVFTPSLDLAAVASQQFQDTNEFPYRSYANFLELRDVESDETIAILYTMTSDEFWQATAPLITALDLSPDGRLLFVAMYTPEPASHSEIAVWNMETYEQVAQFPAHTDAINDLVVSDDGMLIVTSSMDGTVRLWGVLD